MAPVNGWGQDPSKAFDEGRGTKSGSFTRSLFSWDSLSFLQPKVKEGVVRHVLGVSQN